MQTELPKFEGRDVQSSVACFSGRVNQRVGALAQDEFAIVIARVRVNGVQHKDFKAVSGTGPKLFSRIHDLATTRAVLVSEEDGARLLEEAITLADEKFGIDNLFSEVTAEGSADDTDPDSPPVPDDLSGLEGQDDQPE